MKFHELIAYIKSIICRLKLSEMLCLDMQTSCARICIHLQNTNMNTG